MSFNVGSKSSIVGHQAKYGPTADLTPEQQKEVQQHYAPGATKRVTQDDPSHATYVDAADQTGRPLTAQETVAKKTGKNAPASSINHVIASGTGQNVLNHETLQFNHGKQLVDDNYKTASSDPGKVSDPGAIPQAQKQSRLGIAEQAAAVGRTQGYSRAILNEREGEVQDGKPLDVMQKRKDVMQKTLTAFQGRNSQQQVTAETGQERFGAYKEVLKETFDSPGNLRVGDRSANTKISTGVDVPVDVNGQASPRGQRLLDAHKNYAPDRLLTDQRTFTTDDSGKNLSSSQEKTAATPPKQEMAKASEKLKALVNTPEHVPDPLVSAPKVTAPPPQALTAGAPAMPLAPAPKQQAAQTPEPLKAPTQTTPLVSAPKVTAPPPQALTAGAQTIPSSTTGTATQPSRKRPRPDDGVQQGPAKKARTETTSTAPSRKRPRTEETASGPPAKKARTETNPTAPSGKRPRQNEASGAGSPPAKRRKTSPS